MPNFNFAKGKASRKDDRTSAGATRSRETGQSRPVSTQQPVDDLPIELNETPQRERATQPQRDTHLRADTQPQHGERVAPSSKQQRPQASSSKPSPKSVLDNYPERDLSHLESSSPRSTRNTEFEAPSEEGEADATKTHGAYGGEEQSTTTSTASKQKHSQWPLFVIIGIVVLLAALAFLWHVNPWPSLTQSISALFTTQAPTTVIDTPVQDAVPEDVEAPPLMRSWDYYLQVSSWKELASADREAERFRAQGLSVVVEGESIPARGGTFYRVRLGPYESAGQAYEAAATFPGLIPIDAFIDSVRLADDVAMERPHASQHENLARQPVKKTDRTSLSASRNWSEFDIIDEPLSGYAVKVSSFRSLDAARVEARKLLDNSYPSFVTRANVAGAVWYRVLVGPFSDKRDADKYMRLLNVTWGNEAYTVDLSSETY